jgi:cell wall-associated NlpC family hydrolase
MLEKILFFLCVFCIAFADNSQVAAPIEWLGQERYQQDTAPYAQSESEPVLNSDVVGDLLLQAMSLMGVAYRFGGNSPSQGLDCSGFMVYIFKKSMNITLPRTAAEMAKIGISVSKDSLQQGDLVFFNTRGFANSHVGMYIGQGKFIHAPRTGKNIEIVSLASKYWSERYNGAKRIERKNSFVYPDR